MTCVYMISDLHLGHKNILKFEPELRSGRDYKENGHNILSNWREIVHKRDVVYVLGDVFFHQDWLEEFAHLPGRKKLIRGNHDNKWSSEKLLEVFESIDGMINYKKHWLTHAPMHPAELRGKNNIHGHVHSSSILDSHGKIDPRYINVCVEAIGEKPISFQNITNGTYSKIRRC